MQAQPRLEIGCELGEGPLWDGEALWFFDITGGEEGAPELFRFAPGAGALERWENDRMASAAARTRSGGLLIATETDLILTDPLAGTAERVCTLEADNPATRSNDGRADRQGGFWIGTMGKAAEPGAGALYRFFGGELRQLRGAVSVPNAICFAPDGDEAYFADSALRTIWRWRLDKAGWPMGAPSEFYRFGEGEAPDGAVIDEAGDMWIAVWGGSRIQRIDRGGVAREQVRLPVSQVTCPALTETGDLYITTARQGLDAAALEEQPLAGALFHTRIPQRGLPEPLVLL